MRSIVIAIAVTLPAASQGFAMDSLSQYQWKNRILLVSGPVEDPRLVQQLAILRGQAGELSDRDMLVIQIVGNDAVAVFGAASGIDGALLKTEAAVSDDAFAAVLIGKDGGVKLRSPSVVGASDLFALIDSMPMRRAGQR